jgi:hypothetical protein
MKNVNVVEATIRMLIAQDVSPSEVMSGIHNAFVHGELFEEAGYNVNDKDLGKFFDGIETAQKAVKRMGV